MHRNDLNFAFYVNLHFLLISTFSSDLQWPNTMVYSQDSYVATINTVSWILGAIVIFLTCARIFGRTAVIHQAGWDDVFMGCATVSSLSSSASQHLLTLSFNWQISAIICSALVTTGTTYGLGIHTKDITNPNDKTEAIKYTVIAPAWSIICSSFGNSPS